MTDEIITGKPYGLTQAGLDALAFMNKIIFGQELKYNPETKVVVVGRKLPCSCGNILTPHSWHCKVFYREMQILGGRHLHLSTNHLRSI